MINISIEKDKWIRVEPDDLELMEIVLKILQKYSCENSDPNLHYSDIEVDSIKLEKYARGYETLNKIQDVFLYLTDDYNITVRFTLDLSGEFGYLDNVAIDFDYTDVTNLNMPAIIDKIAGLGRKWTSDKTGGGHLQFIVQVTPLVPEDFLVEFPVVKSYYKKTYLNETVKYKDILRVFYIDGIKFITHLDTQPEQKYLDLFSKDEEKRFHALNDHAVEDDES